MHRPMWGVCNSGDKSAENADCGGSGYEEQRVQFVLFSLSSLISDASVIYNKLNRSCGFDRGDFNKAGYDQPTIDPVNQM